MESKPLIHTTIQVKYAVRIVFRFKIDDMLTKESDFKINLQHIKIDLINY